MNATQRLALVTVVSTFILIVIGVTVRATGSGLGCPDWPLCHGGAVPPAERTALIEFSHRFVAMIVGFLVIGLAIMVWRNYGHVPPLKWVAVFTVPLVGFQGILGAITVVRELPPDIVATHLITAMVILTCVIFVFVGLGRVNAAERGEPRAHAYPKVGKIALFAITWLVAVMWIGAYVAESGGATACADWPTCNGLNMLPGSASQEITHMTHRYLAGGFLVLLALFMLAVKRTTNESWSRPVVLFLGPLYAVQVLVGALNVWFVFPDPLTILHTALATSIWIVLVTILILCSYRPVGLRRASVASRAEVPA